MIDFHTHILPCVDDGSSSIDESILMLKSLAEQNVNKVIATPHFYANDESVDEFVKRRRNAYELLMEKAPSAPNVVLGAEVRYYDGISRLPELKELRIEGTKLLLLEMPFNHWTEFAVKEIVDIASRGEITLVLAHIDRYLPLLNREILTRLLGNGVLFQANASFFNGVFNIPKAVRMLKNNQIHFIGSDCHNMSSRAPNIDKALRVIEKKIGGDALEDYLDFGHQLFQQNII